MFNLTYLLSSLPWSRHCSLNLVEESSISGDDDGFGTLSIPIRLTLPHFLTIGKAACN